MSATHHVRYPRELASPLLTTLGEREGSHP